METPYPVVVVIGPSGSGKSTVVRELHARDLVSVRPTWTTRPRRPDERVATVEHRFVSEENFAWLERHDYFLDTIAMFGLPYRYGLPGPATFAVDRPEIVMLRAPLIPLFRRFCDNFTVVQIEDTEERTFERLMQRNSDQDELRARLRDNERELVAGRSLADVVFVNDDSVAALAARIASRVLRTTGVAA